TEEELAEGLESELLEDPLASEVSLATELEFESDDSEQTDSSQNLDGLLSGELLGGGLGMEGVGTDGIDSDAERVELPADPTVTFFGEEIEGKRIVFLVDNSGGMNGGGLETLIAELLRTVVLLTPKQQFYVIFYSDVAYPLFYPRSVYQFVRPTKENKRQLAAWLDSVELCTGNAVDEGLKAAITTRPDTVFLLTDGRVNTTRDGRKLAAFLDSRGRRFAIHTFGMGTSPTSQATLQLKEIAAANGGRFKQIEITEEMKSLARERRRPYHNKQPGAVWGKKVGSW
ncbi:MAG: VWA domain-containing protein, partial [Lacipirellulaceae bacterium]